MLGSLALSRDSALQSDDNALSAWHQHAESCSNGGMWLGLGWVSVAADPSVSTGAEPLHKNWL